MTRGLKSLLAWIYPKSSGQVRESSGDRRDHFADTDNMVCFRSFRAALELRPDAPGSRRARDGKELR